MLKKLKILLLLIILIPCGLFSVETKSKDSSGSEPSLSVYTDREFRQAVINILQKTNMSTKENFVKELDKVKYGEGEKKERIYGLDNINREFSSGMNGWTIAVSGILVVFSGLILIAVVVQMFNYVLSDRKEVTSKVETVKKEQKSIIQPSEEELVAISTAIELYYRLYIKTSLTNLSFRKGKDSAWKIGRNFGIRKTQRN